MDIELHLEPKSGELSVLKNESGSSSTRENALEYDPDPRTLINARIQTVQYGTYDSNPAALIVFRFVVRFRSGSRRIRNFHVNIEFRNQTQTVGLPQPKVLELRPEDVRGKIFMEERSTTIAGGLQIPLGPPGAPTLSLSDEVARKINREYELKLTGWKMSSSDAVDNTLVWDCAEAKKSARGVVPNYRGACIVQYTAGQPFIATFTLDAEQGIFQFAKGVFDYLNVFAKRDSDDPVVFDPSNPLGHQYPITTDFRDIDLEQLTTFEPISTLPQGYS